MAVEAISPNGEKIFCLSAGKTLPEWIAMAKKRTLAKNQGTRLPTFLTQTEFRSRIELIQDLHFPTSCQRVKFSRDGRHLVATG